MRLVLGLLAVCGVALVAVPAASAQEVEAQGKVERSLDEFLANQGTFCISDGEGGCFQFIADLPNMLIWTPDVSEGEVPRCAVVDYAGLANEYLRDASGGAIDLGTTITGKITEKPPLADGRAPVTIKLNTKDALVYSVGLNCDLLTGAAEFGYLPAEILAGADAALGDAQLEIEYIDLAPGRPLPDLIELVAFSQFGQQVIDLKFSAKARGDLREPFGVPEGTPGQATISFRQRVDAEGFPFVTKQELVIEPR